MDNNHNKRHQGWDYSLVQSLYCLRADTTVLLDVLLTIKRFLILPVTVLVGLLWLMVTRQGTFLITVSVLTITLVFLIVLLQVSSQPAAPRVLGGDDQFVNIILEACPTLRNVYRPPVLWGRNGLAQISVLGMFGRFSLKRPVWERHYCVQSDGTVVTYDEIEPAHTPTPDDLVIVLAPGIGNYSDTHYVRSLALQVQAAGYRCVVVNPVGIPPKVKVTAPRIFTYGETDDFAGVIDDLTKRLPSARLLLVGFSMGGNIVAKYVGEQRQRPPSIIAAISVCQGYQMRGISEVNAYFKGFKRIYILLIAGVMKRFILNHREVLLSDQAKKKFDLDEDVIRKASTMAELDESYSRRIYGYKTLEEFYKGNGSINYLSGTSVPLVLINAEDDPLVPGIALQPLKPLIAQNKKIMLITTRHGGHLGFYDGGILVPESTTWIDKVVLELANVLKTITHDPQT